MKLFVWTEVLTYSGGMAVVLANDIEEARAMILGEVGDHHRREFELQEPDIHDVEVVLSCITSMVADDD